MDLGLELAWFDNKAAYTAREPKPFSERDRQNLSEALAAHAEERRAFAGSISLHQACDRRSFYTEVGHQVQGSSVGPPAGSRHHKTPLDLCDIRLARYANLDEVTRGQMAGAIRVERCGFELVGLAASSKTREISRHLETSRDISGLRL